MNAVAIQDLTKVYKNCKKALSELSLNVKQGEIFSLLGSNGAGKSTLINILNTSSKLTSGKVEILGKPIHAQNYVRSQIACVSQNVSIFNHLTLEENLMFQGRLFHVPKLVTQKYMEQLIKDFELEEYTGNVVSVYSGGIRRRIDIAMSMLSRPKILFLDEPTVALDIISRKNLWKTITDIREKYGTTIFLTTHYLEEADQLSDTVCIMKDGHQLVQDTPRNLKKYIDTNMIKIESFDQNDVPKIQEILKEFTFIRKVHIDENELTINLQEKGKDNNQEELKVIQKKLVENNIFVKAIELVTPNLDDVFLSIISEYER